MAFMYCKLFASLYQGTLRGKSHEILVFTNMLAHADAEGCVDKHFRAIADEVGLAVDEVKAAVANLESPDPESRSPEMDGRRLLRINDHRAWGWKIVNYGKYREIKNDEDRRKANREAQARWRERQKNKTSVNITVMDSNQSVISSNALSSTSAQEEVKEDGDEKERVVLTRASKAKATREEIDQFCRENGLFPRDAEYLWTKWEGNGWVNGKSKIKDWRMTVRSWKAQGYLPSQKQLLDTDYWPSVRPESTDQTEAVEEPHPLAAWFERMQARERALAEPPTVPNIPVEPSLNADPF